MMSIGDEKEIEVGAKTWYDASREIVETYNREIASAFRDEQSDSDFNTPEQFSMIMQVSLAFYAAEIKKNKALEAEIEELYSEIDRLKNK